MNRLGGTANPAVGGLWHVQDCQRRRVRMRL